MPVDVSLFSAFLVGLLGGVHCAGMCGGIVAALTMGLPEARQQGRQVLPYVLMYNLARLLSYTLAGALMGGVGWLAAHWSGLREVQLLLNLFAAVFMILLGLYLSGWWRVLGRLEQLGARLWKIIQPVTRHFMPVQTLHQAFVLGLLWGWLPCGLVYSVLVWSVSTADPLSGGLLMLAFGAGTLPLLLTMGVAAGRLSHWIQRQGVRWMSGALVIGFGLLQLFRVVRSLSNSG